MIVRLVVERVIDERNQTIIECMGYDAEVHPFEYVSLHLRRGTAPYHAFEPGDSIDVRITTTERAL
jgi:hypothetical protein